MNKLLYFVFLFLIFSCKKDESKSLMFKNCKVEYMFYGSGEKELYEAHSISNEWEFESANRKLAICLCEKYLEKADEEIKVKILEIYNTKEKYFSRDLLANMEFDTILKNRNKIFAPTILLD